MSDSVTNGMTAQQFVEAVQAVTQQTSKAAEKASRMPSRARADTSVDQTDNVPGRDVDLASFAEVSYVPAPVNTGRPTQYPDGS